MILEGDRGFPGNDAGCHAPEEQGDDQCEDDGNGIAAEEPDRHHEEHQAMGEAADADVEACAPQQPHAQAAEDPDQRHRMAGGAGIAVHRDHAQPEQRRGIRGQVHPGFVDQGCRHHTGQAHEGARKDPQPDIAEPAQPLHRGDQPKRGYTEQWPKKRLQKPVERMVLLAGRSWVRWITHLNEHTASMEPRASEGLQKQ